jgi:hypothetical protein
MSGPIVRKYGFPNFDKIFGERPLQHGAPESEQTESEPGPADSTEEVTRKPTEKKRSPAKKNQPT